MTSAEPPRLSIVTGTRNRPESVERFVRSVLANVDEPFELLIGDASSQGRFFVSPDPRVVVFPEDPPLGPPRGFNALFRRARGEWVCFLNDDLEVGPGWSRALVAEMERHPEVDFFCLPMIEPGEPGYFIPLYHELPFACLGVVRREVGDALGWFDEGFRFYATDPDLALKAIDAGVRLAPAAGARVLHHRLSEDPSAGSRALYDADNGRLSRMWRPRRRALRRRYRRTSYRYFRHLGTRHSDFYHGPVLEIHAADGAPLRPARRHRVKAWGWWLGI